MSQLRWVAVVLCVLQGGYMVVDGARALLVGSYITPGAGEHAGRLGPWARVVSAIGVPPESTAMKVVFVVLGMAWLAVAVGLAIPAGWAWAAGLVLAIGTLWYLILGTAISIVLLLLLISPQVQRALGRG